MILFQGGSRHGTLLIWDSLFYDGLQLKFDNGEIYRLMGARIRNGTGVAYFVSPDAKPYSINTTIDEVREAISEGTVK